MEYLEGAFSNFGEGGPYGSEIVQTWFPASLGIMVQIWTEISGVLSLCCGGVYSHLGLNL